MSRSAKGPAAKPKAEGSTGQTAVAPSPRPPVFPIVGVGASAGGLEAFVELLRALPDRPGMAFVLIQHQDRAHASFLAEILGKATKMPVSQVNTDVVVGPNRVYVAPPDAELIFEEGQLRMTPRPTGRSMPIDRFFETLAADQGSRAVVVVLSGLASDGTEGAKAVKLAGGITFAQDITAKFNGMPTSATSSGAVDFVMSPTGIATELTRIAEHAKVELTNHFPGPEMTTIFEILQQHFAVDFTHYKPTTIERRIRRRMAVHQTDSVSQYVKLLEDDPGEVERLYGELLIHVTSFFRDPEVFESLKAEVAPQLMTGRDSHHPVRVWVPGCATGEEVYSLAMILLEETARYELSYPIQIFGTDISEGAIEIARAGVYPDTIAAEVSPERLAQFFMKTNGSYRVNKSVRECCIFARQNLTRDPPFSKLDLISCRNVLIYLGASLQRKVIAVLHYALRPNGLLLLGSAETIGNFGDLFTPVNRKFRIYQKKDAVIGAPMNFAAAPVAADTKPQRMQRMPENHDAKSLPSPFQEADRIVMARYAPAGVLINDAMDILQFRGRTSSFLEPAPGTASLNLLRMLREGLLPEVRAAIQTAKKNNLPVRREGVRFRNDGTTINANIEVLPFTTPGSERHFILSFEEVSTEVERKRKRGSKAPVGKPEPRQVVRLKAELEATREYLQSIIEEQEAMNEELRSANEEIQSSNEELQSTNEELETAKEELQSTNEELATLNEELENRHSEMTVVNNDLTNLISSIEIPIIMVDSRKNIRRFTPGAQRALHLLPSDIGRPISDLQSKLRFDGLDNMISQVVETLETREKEVQAADGSWHSLRIRPYKTTENRIDGAVIALVDIRRN